MQTLRSWRACHVFPKNRDTVLLNVDRRTMFMYWKTQHSKDATFPQKYLYI